MQPKCPQSQVVVDHHPHARHPPAGGRATDNGLRAPELPAAIARGKGAESIRVRSGNWRILWQAQALLNTPDITTAAGLHRAIITRRSVSRGLLARRFHFIPPA